MGDGRSCDLARKLSESNLSQGLPSLEHQARAPIEKLVALVGAEVVAPDNAGKQAAALMPASNSKEEPKSGAATPESGRRGKRGRPQTIPDEKKAAAAQLKASGGTNAEIATLIYDTKYPTDQQKKNIPSILRHHEQKSKQSRTAGKPPKATPRPNKYRG